jgi:hypothetical protein
MAGPELFVITEFDYIFAFLMEENILSVKLEYNKTDRYEIGNIFEKARSSTLMMLLQQQRA